MLKRKRAHAAVLFAIVIVFGSSVCPFVARAAERMPSPEGAKDIVIASAEPLDLTDQQTRPRLEEPFGRQAAERVNGSLQKLWRSASKKLPGEHRILALCRMDAEKCPAAATRFLAVINRAAEEDGWTRIAEINRAINLDIRPVSDIAQYGSTEVWPTPLMAFAANAGDCKDYAIAKYVALRELGFAEDDLRLVIVHIRGGDEYHAVVAARFDSRWLVLDNRTSELKYDVDVADYDPRFVVDGDDVKGMTIPTPQVAEHKVAPTRAKAMLFAGPEYLSAVG
jgi:predicted transglutaminase-like cysteine proteinase